MENRIKSYEKFIAKESKKYLDPDERQNLAAYHKEMLLFFQHERLIHLIIMFFFITIALILLALLIWSISTIGPKLELICFYVLTAIITILSIAYAKHYYFLENHIQSLYDYTTKIRFSSTPSSGLK